MIQLFPENNWAVRGFRMPVLSSTDVAITPQHRGSGGAGTCADRELATKCSKQLYTQQLGTAKL